MISLTVLGAQRSFYDSQLEALLALRQRKAFCQIDHSVAYEILLVMSEENQPEESDFPEF